MNKLVVGSVLFLAMASAQAVASPRWNNATLSYQSVDLDGDKLTGFGLSGTKLLNANVFINGGFNNAAGEGYSLDLDYGTKSLGLGFRSELSQQTDLYGLLSYEYVKLEGSNGWYSQSASEDGFGLAVGVRSMMTDKLELNAGFKFMDIAEESDTALVFGAMYDFGKAFSAGVSYARADDTRTITVSGVYYF